MIGWRGAIEYEQLRVRNSDTQKGKSGGYRLIYYVQTATGIILWKKSDFCFQWQSKTSDKTLKVWDLETGKEQLTLADHTELSILPNNASTDNSGNCNSNNSKSSRDKVNKIGITLVKRSSN